ncbi:MAG TPA: DUF2721 domain-containing protein [Lacipirellulaceae bacterium]|jgi:hypothetical protein|nr:DUF2721 domain-containing protein [Lacipirellulaceae bacterium]
MHLADIIPILQISIGPVILISGVGLLIGSMNNRLGRTIDRSRVLIESRNRASDGTQCECDRQQDQLTILWRRAQILRTAITLAVFCVLLVATLIIVVFIGALTKLEIGFVVVTLFAASLSSLIGSLVYFIRDVNISLRALELKISYAAPTAAT